MKPRLSSKRNAAMTLFEVGIVVAVVLIVAVLLIMLIAAANRVDKHAQHIWDAGKQIAGNTVSIWMLNVTNRVAGQILEGALSINNRAASIDTTIGALADALGPKR